MKTYLITIYKPKSGDSVVTPGVDFSIRLDNVTDDYFKGYIDCLKTHYAEELIIVNTL